MKFIHIADVHLGARPDAGPLYTDRRPGELWKTFEHVVKVCQDEQTDLLLIAGDLFHRQPLARELKEVNYLFSRLTHTKVVLIAGNHDYIGKNSNYRSFCWCKNVYPLFGQNIQYADFPDFDTAVYGLSYQSREIQAPLYDGLKAAGVRRFEILLAHGGDAKHIPFNRQKLECSGFDYVALGHIHRPQVLLKDRIIYAGALEPIDKNDTGKHGYIKGEFTGEKVKIQWVPCAVRQYVHLNIEVCREDTMGSIKSRIQEQIKEKGNENIYKITIKGRRDPDISFDPEYMTGEYNILDLSDETHPDYDFEQLYREHADSILGRYIEQFRGCREDSMEYRALCEGVEALLQSSKTGK